MMFPTYVFERHLAADKDHKVLIDDDCIFVSVRNC